MSHEYPIVTHEGTECYKVDVDGIILMIDKSIVDAGLTSIEDEVNAIRSAKKEPYNAIPR